MSADPVPTADPRPFPALRCFVMVVGNARSGSTLLGAALDAHPRAVIANESFAWLRIWKDATASTILRDVFDNATAAAAAGRPSAGYAYQFGLAPAAKRDVLVAGGKIWNPALLLVHGDPSVLPTLEATLGVPVRLIHAIRDPFDVIASMHRRSGAPIADRIRWFFMHCEAAMAVRARLPPDRFVESHLADLLADPAGHLGRLGDFLGLPRDPEHVAAVSRRLFAAPRRTAAEIPWTAADITDIRGRMAGFDFLDRYLREPPPAGAEEAVIRAAGGRPGTP